MRVPTPLLLSALLLAPAATLAADTPGANPSVPQPTVQDRLAKARQALGRNDWSGAQRELAVAVREAPQNADVHNLLGYTYRKRASPDLAKAFEHYEIALKIDPRHKGAHEYIGEAYLMVGNLPKAKEHLGALDKLCFFPCDEFRDLKRAISDHEKTKGK